MFLRDQDGTIARLAPLCLCTVATSVDQNPKSGDHSMRTPMKLISGAPRSWSARRHPDQREATDRDRRPGAAGQRRKIGFDRKHNASYLFV